MKAASPVRGRIALVTGATRGIGLATATALARRGAIVYAGGRPESLHRLREGSSRLRPTSLDVRDGERCRACVAEIEREHGRLDILVNNAAVSYRCLVTDATDADIRDQVETNFLGPLNLIRAALPGMQQRRRGHIVNVSSVGGMMAMPTMGLYSATKFALEGLSEALWYEGRLHGVRVSLVEPGFTRTGALDHVRHGEGARLLVGRPGTDADFYAVFDAFVRSLYRRYGSPVSSVVRTILRVLESPDPALRHPATRDAKFFFLLRRLLPRRLYHEFLFRQLPRSIHPRWERDKP